MIPLLATLIALYVVARLLEMLVREYRTGSPAPLLMMIYTAVVIGVVACVVLIYHQAGEVADAASAFSGLSP